MSKNSPNKLFHNIYTNKNNTNTLTKEGNLFATDEKKSFIHSISISITHTKKFFSFFLLMQL
jgi:phosphopantetheinyl transferase (holo-ACP synthase)